MLYINDLHVIINRRVRGKNRDRQSCLADRLADYIGLRIRFDAGVDMPGGVRRNCTYVTRVLGLIPRLYLLRGLCENSPTKNPGTLPGVLFLIEETRQAASCAFCFLRQRP